MNDAQRTRPLRLVAYALFGVGTILMLAMAFHVMAANLALFLGTSAFVVGGLAWGIADDGADGAREAANGDQGPTVSRRQP